MAPATELRKLPTLASLEEKILPELKQKYWIDYSFEGRSADQKETIMHMKWGGILGLTLIYIVLAWVFASSSIGGFGEGASNNGCAFSSFCFSPINS